MDPVFKAVRCELHPNKRFKIDDVEWSRGICIGDIGRRRQAIGRYFFSGENHVDGVACLRTGTVKKHVDALYMTEYKAGSS